MTHPSLDLFPDPGQPSEPPTWEDFERLALNYPSVHTIVTLVERGDLTREQGLVAAVYWFATAFSRQFQRELEASRLEVLDTVAAEPCGCSTATYARRRYVKMLCESHKNGEV